MYESSSSRENQSVIVFEVGNFKIKVLVSNCFMFLGASSSSFGGGPAHQALRRPESIQTGAVAGRGSLAY